MWSGRGDANLKFRHGRITNAEAAFDDRQEKTVPYEGKRRDQAQDSLWTPFYSEEKFTVLPADVREHITRTVDDWTSRHRFRRTSLTDSMAAALTVFAHATFETRLDWTPFLQCHYTDAKLLRILRCYKNTMPEPGTYFGEIVAHFFQHCKQQGNLNVKRDTKSAATASQKRKQSDLDKTYQVIMTLKQSNLVLVVVCATLKRPFAFVSSSMDDTTPATNTVEEIAAQHVENEFLRRPSVIDTSTVVWSKVECLQLDNACGGSFYFSIAIDRPTAQRAKILDELFTAFHVYNRNEKDSVLKDCTVVYCSDTLYFMNISQRLFIDNSTTFIYCSLTGKHKPVIETSEDTFLMGLSKILAGIQYFTESSLKRNQNNKLRNGPMTAVITEGGLNESSRFVNAMYRQTVLDDKDPDDSVPDVQPLSAVGHDTNTTADQYSPRSPTYAPDAEKPPSSPPRRRLPTTTREANGLHPDTTNMYVVNEPYINTFVNRPVESGCMY